MAITTLTPADDAIRAARSLLFIPPVPSSLLVMPAIPATSRPMSSTVETRVADGSVPGSAEYRPSTLVSRTNRFARSRHATIEARVSLWPKRISATATVSFSLTIGRHEYSNRVRRVLRTFRQRVRWSKSLAVSSTWAAWMP